MSINMWGVQVKEVCGDFWVSVATSPTEEIAIKEKEALQKKNSEREYRVAHYEDFQVAKLENFGVILRENIHILKNVDIFSDDAVDKVMEYLKKKLD